MFLCVQPQPSKKKELNLKLIEEICVFDIVFAYQHTRTLSLSQHMFPHSPPTTDYGRALIGCAMSVPPTFYSGGQLIFVPVSKREEDKILSLTDRT